MSIPDWNWADRAACKGTDPDASIFFGLDGERGPERDKREAKAKAICAGCTVRLRCLNFALAAPEPHGVWGCTTEEERAAERRRYLRRIRERAA